MAAQTAKQQLSVEDVLAALADLSAKAASPTVRVCLEAAREDIAFLSDTGESDNLDSDDESAI